MAQNLELVEKLVEKTGLSYTEAKAALEKADGDILEALIQLEAVGKISGGKTTTFSTNTEHKEYKEYSENQQNKQGKEKSTAGENFKKTSKSIGEWLKDILDKGNKNCIEMYRNGERKIEFPVTVFVLMLIFCFWFVIPLMIVGLFFGCRYSFSGQELGKDCVNNAMGKATDIADNIKNEFKTNDKGNE